MTGTVPPNLSDIEGPGPAPPTMPLKMEIYFKVRNKQLFDARADPDSPEYMRKMSIEEEDAVFGPLRSGSHNYSERVDRQCTDGQTRRQPSQSRDVGKDRR
jgi:hypothetical protein